MAVVELDVGLFREMYPKFKDCSEDALALWFGIACTLVGNAENSPVPYDPPAVTTRKALLYMTLCHLAELLSGDNAAVGRVASATEGSVSASFDYPAASKNAAWWNQTRCGALAWQLLLPWRTGGIYFHGGPKY